MPVADFKIPDVPPRGQYVATAGQINFPIPFRFFEEEDVEVYLNENLLPENPNSYTITGAGTNANGNLDFDVGQLEDTVVTIVRNSAIERTVNFINSGDWRAQNVNDQFNRLVTFIQEVKLKAVDLALSLPLTSLLSVLTIPDEGAAANASRVWMWDATGTQLINGPSAQNIFDANETLEDLGDIADEVEINRVATEAARDGAVNAQAAAEAAANSALWSNVIFLTFANSPYTVTSANAGDLLSVNSTGGAVVINLPQISGISSPFNLGIKKTSADANVITINRAGTDTIDGATNKTLTLQNQGTTLVADTDPAPDIWTSADFGTATTVADGAVSTAAKIADGIITYAKMATAALATTASDLFSGGANLLVTCASFKLWQDTYVKKRVLSFVPTAGQTTQVVNYTFKAGYNYVLVCRGISFALAASLAPTMEMSQDNGATYDTAAGDYIYKRFYGKANVLGDSGSYAAAVTNTYSVDANIAVNTTIELLEPMAGGTNRPAYTAKTDCVDGSTYAATMTFGRRDYPVSINKVRLVAAANWNATGTITLYEEPV